MRKSILTAAVIIMVTVSAFSQSVTETRQIKTTTFQIYENYKVEMSGLHNKSTYTEDNFMALFSNNAILYNDIIPANTPVQLFPGNYYDYFIENIKRIYDPVYSNFKMGDPVAVENKWQIKCSFTRSARFRTKTDMNYPEWSFNYTMTIEMDKRYDTDKKVYENAKIVSVEVENPLKDFFIIENKENIPLVTKSGEILKEWDEEYQSRIFPENKYEIKDIQALETNIFEYSKTTFSTNQTDDRFYQFNVQKFKKDIFGAGINVAPATAWGNKIRDTTANVVNPDTPIVTKHTSVLSFSFFYGKQIFHKEKSTLFANIGLDLNLYFHKFSPANNKIDVQSNPNYYQVIFNSSDSKFTVFSLSVPLSVQYLLQLTEQGKKPLFLSFELGGFAEFSAKRDSLPIGYSNTLAKCIDNIKELDNGVKRNTLESKLAGGGIFGGVGLWIALNNNNLLKINLLYKYNFRKDINIFEDNHSSKFSLYTAENGLHNITLGVSWIKTIGKK